PRCPPGGAGWLCVLPLQDRRRNGDQLSDWLSATHLTHLYRRLLTAAATSRGQAATRVGVPPPTRPQGAVTSGRLGSAPVSSGLGPRCWSCHHPAAATMAALSVHMARLGSSTRRPAFSP